MSTCGRPPDVHSTIEARFCLDANTDPQGFSIFTKGAPDVIGYPARELLIVSRLGMNATKHELHEGFKAPAIVDQDRCHNEGEGGNAFSPMAAMKSPNPALKAGQVCILNKLGRDNCIEIHQSESGSNSITFWCALALGGKVSTQLKQPDRDVLFGYVKPGPLKTQTWPILKQSFKCHAHPLPGRSTENGAETFSRTQPPAAPRHSGGRRLSTGWLPIMTRWRQP